MPELVAPPRLHRINALLEAGLALQPAERVGWLGQLPAEDQTLMPLLASMLARSASETDTFLGAPLRLAPGELELAALEPDQPGQRIGPWRLLRELGQGGMATVWLAERADGGLQRQVALKLPRSGWALGLAQRMARERDILAALEHPRIARLYDAGLTADGRPWLAMECVFGEPIDQHCRQRALPVSQRLRLFLQVTEAVTHAHARLVVHRDLKPSNILVNDEGEVHLLDFGVAKLLEDEPAPGAALTELLGRAVTPDYAAPEQVAGRPVTVATDVYSLGIVLYELLTGARPYRLGRVTMATLEDAILHAEVAPASGAVRGNRALVRQLSGDLDAIVAKALAKAPGQRYASVEALADDLRRHLAGQPVLAQRPSRRYRLGKFVRRHHLVLTAVTLGLGSLVVGLTVALWQTREAQVQADFARRNFGDGEAALEIATKLMAAGVRPGERLSAEELLERRMQLVESVPLSRPRDRAIAAQVLIDWAISLGRDRDANLMYERLLGAVPAQDIPALIRCKRGGVLAENGRIDEGVRLLEMAAAEEPDNHLTALTCAMRRSQVARNRNDAQGALTYALLAQHHLEASGHEDSGRRAVVAGDLGYALSLNGRPGEADRQFSSALALVAEAGRSQTVEAVDLHNAWGVMRLHAGDVLGALRRFERAAAIVRRDDPAAPLPQYLQFNIANAWGLMNHFDKAEAMFENLRAEARQGGSASTELAAINALAAVAQWQGHFDAARQHLAQGSVLMARHPMPPTDPASITHHRLWTEQALAEGRTAEALERVDVVLARLAQTGVRVGRLSNVLLLRSRIQAAAGHPDAALSDGERALDIARQVQGEMPHSVFAGDASLNLARLHQAAGRADAARSAAREAAAHLAAALGEAHRDVLEARRLAVP